ncbi:ultraviolet-B receptor UVR8 isoform X2 [Cannabis sativa]|uniref:ultraviolet-B receptor UVR8 isoform X2 n=1 Tax=Cannabis sativa TaxID=3483 RepID=UPI0029CA6C26|nr:ultraviolet-B receptor UVR8 isoform X2 [Cannabis sativa]
MLSRIGSVRSSSLSLGFGLVKRWLWSKSDTGQRFAVLWGNGDYGRLGLGSLDSHWSPAPVLCSAFRDQGLRAIACGGAHTLFLTDRAFKETWRRKKLALCWRSNLTALKYLRVVAHKLSPTLTETGRVYATGLNDFGQLGISDDATYSAEPLEVSGLPKEIVRISAGYYHSGAITVDGELYMWGKNANGQLGLGKRAPKAVPLPTKVESLIGLTIKMAALGSEHSVAVTDGGEALSWGGGEYGRLGHANDSTSFSFFKSTSEYMPRLIKKLEGIKVKYVAAGLLHSACIDESGSAFVFGERPADRLGFRENSEATPSLIAELPYSEEVACGGYHTCVLSSGGKLYTWGSNENGCLGIGTTMVFHQPERVQGPFSECIVSQVSCGWKHTAAISEGKVFTWGWGGSHGTFSVDGHSSGGQLGHGNDVDYMKPTMINLGGDVKAFQVSCGFNHTGAILEHI